VDGIVTPLGRFFPVFLVKNCGWRRGLLFQKLLGLALVAKPNVVRFG